MSVVDGCFFIGLSSVATEIAELVDSMKLVYTEAVLVTGPVVRYTVPAGITLGTGGGKVVDRGAHIVSEVALPSLTTARPRQLERERERQVKHRRSSA